MPTPSNKEPPMVIVLKRKSIRNFTDGQRVALYHNDALGIDVTFPYQSSGNLKSPITLMPNQKAVPKDQKTVKEEVEELDEGLRLQATYHNADKTKTAKVYKDNEWEEHRVKFYTNGKHHVEADHHSDKEDAHDTAKHWVKESVDDEVIVEAKIPTSYLSFADWHENAEKKGGEGTKFKMHNGGKSTSAFKGDKKLGTFHHDKTQGHIAEQEVSESVVHRINNIAANGKEDAVIFRNGGSARIHPNTAKLIMDLHGSVNAGNKKKLSEILNASPRGLEKIAKFAIKHAEDQKAKKGK